jgi:hypothetical protein
LTRRHPNARRWLTQCPQTVSSHGIIIIGERLQIFVDGCGTGRIKQGQSAANRTTSTMTARLSPYQTNPDGSRV